MYKSKYFILKLLSLIISITLALLIVFEKSSTKYTIVLDSRCTKDEENLQEENNSYTIITKLNKILSADFNVVNTCKIDDAVYLDERVDIINKVKPDLVINVEYSNIKDYEIYPSTLTSSLDVARIFDKNFKEENLKGNLFYYYLPIVKGEIHRVEKVSIEDGLKEEPTLKLFEKLKFKTLVILQNDDEKFIDLYYSSLKEYFRID